VVGSLNVDDKSNIQVGGIPVLGRIKEDLMKFGALKVQMTGSGPTIFGIFDDAPDLEKWEMPDSGDWQLFWVRPVTLPGMVVDI